MAQNTPAARIPLGFRNPPRAGMAAGQARPVHANAPMARGGGARGGRNPLSTSTGEGYFPTQDVPITGLPSLVENLALHPMMVQRAKDETQRYQDFKNQADEKTQAQAQTAIDSYMKNLQASGNPGAALVKTFTSNEDGVHAGNPNSFNAVMAIHQAMTSAQGPGGPGLTTQDLGHGLVGVSDGSKWTVHKAGDLAGGKGVKGPGGQYGTYSVNPSTGGLDFHPTTVEGQPQAAQAGKVTKATTGEMNQLQDLQTVLENVGKMKNAIGATGSFAVGSINRRLAMNSPLGGPQAEAYNQAYNDMTPALVRLSRTPGNAKLFGEIAMQRLPKPGEASAFLINQALPSIALQAREQVGSLYTAYKAENSAALPKATELVQTFEAHPKQMQDISQARDELQKGPGMMSDHSVAVLQREAAHDNLAYDDKLRVLRQMAQRGLISQEDLPKVAASHLDFNNITPDEMTAPQFQKPPPGTGPGVQPIPGNVPAVQGDMGPQSQDRLNKRGEPLPPGAGRLATPGVEGLTPNASVGMFNGSTDTSAPPPNPMETPSWDPANVVKGIGNMLFPPAQSAEMQPGVEGMPTATEQPPPAQQPMAPPPAATAQEQQTPQPTAPAGSDQALANEAMQGPSADELARQSAAQHLIEQARELSTQPEQ